MPQAVAIYWNQKSLDYTVAKSGHVVAVGSVAAGSSASEQELGDRLASELSEQLSGKTKAIVALPRGKVQWQHLSLPPCPADELPDLVQLQADRDASVTDDDLGFDFLPLAGDQQHPHQVIAVTISPSDIQQIQRVCQTANLSLESIVPLSVGLPAITASDANGSQVFVAPLAAETTIWAARGNKTCLLRQFPQAAEADIDTITKSISNQLRRTLLTLSQEADFSRPSISLVDSGTANTQLLAEIIQQTLDQPVTVISSAAKLPGLDSSEYLAPQHTPLASLAMQAAGGNLPLVDVLNPRRRPEPAINYRTYALAATAAALLVLTLGWGAYSSLTTPLSQAAEDQAALDILNENLDDLAKYEQDASVIRKWLAESPNALNHLQHLSHCLRPAGFKDEDFSVNDDVMLTKFSLDKRQLVIDALARSSQAVQPFEARLRKAAYTPQRGKSSSSKQQGYRWQFKTVLQIDSGAEVAAQPLNASATTKAAQKESKPADSSQSGSSQSGSSQSDSPQTGSSHTEEPQA